MRTRLFALLAAVAVLSSLFMPWLVGPFGSAFVPSEMMSNLDARQIERMASNPPIEGVVFLASFPLALFFALLALIGRENRFQAILTGAFPVGLVGYAVIADLGRFEANGLQIPRRDLGEILARLSEIVGPGFYAWIGGALVLILLGLFDPGKTRS